MCAQTKGYISNSTNNPPPKRSERTPQDVDQMTEVRKKTSKALDSPKVISEMEEVPAYKRREVMLDDVKAKAEATASKLSINIDENDNPVIGRNNSFFHDNVD